MSIDVQSYLNSKAMPIKRASDHEVHTPCVFCHEPGDKRGRLYINIDPNADVPGLYFCHKCGEKGNLVTLKRHFGDSVGEKEEASDLTYQILQAAAKFYHERLGDYEDVLAYLKGPKRGLNINTIIDHKLGYAPQETEYDVADKKTYVRPTRLLYKYLQELGFTPKDILKTGLVAERKTPSGKKYLVDSLSGMVTIPYHVAGNVVWIRGRAWPFDDDDWDQWSGKRYDPFPSKYKSVGGSTTRLFNTDVTWGADEVCITEGEFDALMLQQQGFPAVGVPGAKAWQDPWDGYMERIKRVFLVFDRDAEGEMGAKKLVDRFGTKVRRILISEEGVKCDPTKWFSEGHTAVEFEDLLNEARKGGLLVNVWDAIDEFEKRQALPGLKFNYELLDHAIDPGLQPSQVFVILAKTGTGKTISLLNIMQRMRMVASQVDMKILFLSLEQTRGEWWDRARRIHRFYNPENTDDRAAADFWNDNILIADKNRLGMVEFRQIMDDFDYRMGKYPDLICLDYLGYFARSWKGSPYERVSDAMMQLKEFGKEGMVPIITPHQVSRLGKDGEEISGDAARDSGVVEETADFLEVIWTPDNSLMRNEEEKNGSVHGRLAKSRHGGKGTLLEMQFAPVSLAMVPKGDELAHRARMEFNVRREYRDGWAKMAYRHRTGQYQGMLNSVPLSEYEQKVML